MSEPRSASPPSAEAGGAKAAAERLARSFGFAEVDPDDADASHDTGAELLQRELGATVIDTINHEE